MPKDKLGNNLTWKEYVAKWKEGIAQIDITQQTKIQIRSTWISIFGLSLGIGLTLYNFNNYFWLFLILVGGLGNISIQQIALYQKYNMLKTFQIQEERIQKIEQELLELKEQEEQNE